MLELENLPSPLVLASYREVQWQNDMTIPFLQEANFWWLTGVCSAGFWFVWTGEKGYLIRLSRSETDKLFNGENAVKSTSNLEVVSYTKGRKIIRTLSTQYDSVYTVSGSSRLAHSEYLSNDGQKKLVNYLKTTFQSVKDATPLFLQRRAIKRHDEIEKLRSAVDITKEAFSSYYDQLASNKYEYEIEALFGYVLRKKNAHHAYEPIVASGKNALTLHYNQNSDKLPQDGLVLIDIGARVDGYCADITRTYAIGTPSPREIAVHAAVQKAHYAIIDLIKPGVSLSEYQAKSDEIMKQALRGLDLLKKPEDYRKYFPHAISHGLGIDVHESLGGYKEFMPGMVLTVEPGIYIPEEGIGVRIEDDILVTETGHENLSAALSTDL